MQLEVGAVVEGRVTRLAKFGAFVELPGGKTGLVYISEIAHTFVKEVGDHLSVGQDVRVKVLTVAEDGKISLSVKQATEPPPPRARGGHAPRAAAPRAATPAPGRPGSFEWQPRQAATGFEDMMSHFKQSSEEKISDLRRSVDGKHGGFSRRGKGS